MRLIIILMAILFSLEFAQSNTLMAGSTLKINQSIFSSNRMFFLTLKDDGNLCVYTAQNKFVWCNDIFGFSGATSTLTKDGNFVVYDRMNQSKWSSQTHPDYNSRYKKPIYQPVKLVLGNDGLLMLYNSRNDVVWSNKNGVMILDPNTRFMSSESKNSTAAFFTPNGGFGNFSLTYVYILTTMISVQDLVKVSNFKQAKIELDKLWSYFPVGDERWYNYNSEDKKFKTNNGFPLAYTTLRILSEIVDYKLKNTQPSGEILESTFLVILVNCSEGKQPKTVEEFLAGGGQFEKRTIDPRLKANSYKIINESSDLFRRYVNAITEGKLNVKFQVHEVNNYCAETKVYNGQTRSYAQLSNYLNVFKQVPNEILYNGDYIWIIYPSVTPVDGVNSVAANAGFDKYDFVTGGTGVYGNRAVFALNDNWILKKSAHLGYGDMSDYERRSEIPAWLNHEFFHHLYRLYPDLKLEVNGHDWFNRAFWPEDFEGRFNTDYYFESVHKRLQLQKPLLAFLLKPSYKPTANLLNSLNISMFVGKTFDCSEYTIQNGGQPNNWHYATIIEENNKYFWKNYANRRWELVPDFENSKLLTKDDCPYRGSYYDIILKKIDTGEFVNQIEGLRYQNGLYKMK